MVRSFNRLVAAAVILLSLQGCAALPLAAVGGGMVQAGAGAVVKTGTEYTTGGVAKRTFTVPKNAVRAAVLAAFQRTGVSVERDDESERHEEIVGQLRRRAVRLRLTPLSDTLTSVSLQVKRNWLVKDRATSSELLEQIEQALAENPVFAQRLHRHHIPDGVAASPY